MTTPNTTRSGYVATSATSAVAIRATTYTAQASAVQRSVNSTSASDAGAGTGAQKVRITYFDGSMNGPFTEDITLNGITAVNTVGTNIQFIEMIEVIQVGGGGSNVGTIQLFTTVGGGGSVFGSIAASDNRTFWAHHYVGASLVCHISGFRSSATVANGGTTLQTAGDPTQSNLPFTNVTGILRHGTTTNPLTFDPPLAVVGPNFIVVNEKPDVSSASTSYGSFDFADGVQ